MKIMQHLGINFGGIWRFELRFFIWLFWAFLLKKSGLIKSPLATLPPKESYVCSLRITCNAIIYLS